MVFEVGAKDLTRFATFSRRVVLSDRICDTFKISSPFNDIVQVANKSTMSNPIPLVEWAYNNCQNTSSARPIDVQQ